MSALLAEAQWLPQKSRFWLNISVVHNEKHGLEKLAGNGSNNVRKLLQSSMIDVLVG
ncbi:MAG: hypothetical protein HQ518_00155 [Rhodopirellula sp.]|nr:hypothetical protein [Rhodopirellula sp.]